jgi:hypothetical protein
MKKQPPMKSGRHTTITTVVVDCLPDSQRDGREVIQIKLGCKSVVETLVYTSTLYFLLNGRKYYGATSANLQILGGFVRPVTLAIISYHQKMCLRHPNGGFYVEDFLPNIGLLGAGLNDIISTTK